MTVQCLALSVREAAKTLGLSHVTLYKEINAGRLKTFTVGKKRRLVSLKALQEYISEREEEARCGVEPRIHTDSTPLDAA